MTSRSLILPEVIRNNAESSPERIAIQQVGGGDTTFGELHRSSLTWADGLRRLGVGPGDTVATMIPTSTAAYEAWLGVAWNRAIEVPINHDYRAAMLQYVLASSQTRIVVVASEFREHVEPVVAELTHVETLVVPDDSKPEPLRGKLVIGRDELFADARPIEMDAPGYHEPFGVIYTSGTTGASKGVLGTWALLCDGEDNPFPGAREEPCPDGAYYCPWAPFHLSGKNGLSHAVGLGLRLVLRGRFSLSNFWDDVRAYNCTHTLLSFIAPWLWRQQVRPDDHLNPLQRVCMVPLLPEFRQFGERFGVKISTSWASTEAGFPINTADPPNHRTCGRPRPGYQVKVVDEYDEEVAPGTVGELVVRHDKPWIVFGGGYLGMPEATAAASRNGWFHTGDAFTRDDEGWFYFVDRLKDYIKHRGHSISAAEVEREVGRHPDVEEVACIGVASDLAESGVLGDEDVKIFVVMRTESAATPAQLIEFLSPTMPRFMVPRYVELVDSLPRNHLNKVDKSSLRKRVNGPATWDRERADFSSVA